MRDISLRSPSNAKAGPLGVGGIVVVVVDVLDVVVLAGTVEGMVSSVPPPEQAAAKTKTLEVRARKRRLGRIRTIAPEL